VGDIRDLSRDATCWGKQASSTQIPPSVALSRALIRVKLVVPN
jgi:hypothetical protein